MSLMAVLLKTSFKSDKLLNMWSHKKSVTASMIHIELKQFLEKVKFNDLSELTFI